MQRGSSPWETATGVQQSLDPSIGLSKTKHCLPAAVHTLSNHHHPTSLPLLHLALPNSVLNMFPGGDPFRMFAAMDQMMNQMFQDPFLGMQQQQQVRCAVLSFCCCP